MSGICGWIDGPQEDGQAHATLDRMRRALRDRDSAGPRPIVSGGCALAVEAGIRAVTLDRAETLVAAVEGQVRWRTPSLAAVAEERGAAAAVAKAYRQHGSGCLKEMLGPFAVAVIDTQGASGLLAIDRLGTRTMVTPIRLASWCLHLRWRASSRIRP
jgi:asparagine synthetase B (glutamine-hydrolysing)